MFTIPDPNQRIVHPNIQMVTALLLLAVVGAASLITTEAEEADEPRHEYVVVTVKRHGYVSAQGLGMPRSETLDWNTCKGFHGTQSECEDWSNLFDDPQANMKDWPDTFRCYRASEAHCLNLPRR